MGIEHFMAQIFRMDEKTWQRHANPWSVWTRYLTLPLLVFIIWSRMWIGFWFLPLLVLGLIWLFLNPRAFAKPKTTNSWPSKGTFGERIWLARKEIPIPNNHAKMAKWLALAAGLGQFPLIYGLVTFDLYTTLVGLVFINLFKSWFIDRMVWLYEDMKHIPEYSSWLY